MISGHAPGEGLPGLSGVQAGLASVDSKSVTAGKRRLPLAQQMLATAVQ